MVKNPSKRADYPGRPRRIAALMYVLLRFLDARSRWPHSFTRLFTCLRAVLWQHRELLAYLRSYGTAGGSLRMQWAPQQARLLGFD